MRAIAFMLGLCACAAATATTEVPAPAHTQSFACPIGGCEVSCPAAGAGPAIRFKANALKLTLLPSRVAVFETTSSLDKRKTYLVDLSERNCEIVQ